MARVLFINAGSEGHINPTIGVVQELISCGDYISLGTVFNQAIDFYKLCFEAFGNTDHTIVMSIGSKVQI